MIVWFALWIAVTAAASAAAVTVDDVREPWYVRVVDAIVRRCRRRRVFAAVPVGPPIEEIAVNLRRLQTWLDRYDDPEPLPGKATKMAATRIAYDRVLCEACRALAIPESLEETEGIDREAERLRIQAALREAGFVLSTPHRTGS